MTHYLMSSMVIQKLRQTGGFLASEYLIKDDGKSLKLLDKTNVPRWLTSSYHVDSDTMAGAEKFGNGLLLEFLLLLVVEFKDIGGRVIAYNSRPSTTVTAAASPQAATSASPPNTLPTDQVTFDDTTNTSAASSLGTYFLSQISLIFLDMLNVYRYKAAMIEDVPRIFEAVFQCTLEVHYPEHRLKFFSLLRAIATHCFPALINLSSEQLKLVMDSIIWAFRHTEKNIAETGLNLLLEMLKNFQASEFCNQFYKSYFLTIEQEIFAVLTDTFHKPGFKLHVLVLQHLFCSYAGPTMNLCGSATVPYPYLNNAMFVREYTIKLLGTSFPNMTASEVTQFVNGLFESRTNLSIFKNHIRDFLVQSKEFSAQLLSEEVFDFSRGEMTQQKIKELQQSLNSEFQLIHELCLYVLSASQRTELIRATLSTLHAFLSWIPLGYIFESPLVCEILLNSFQTELVVGTVTIDFRCQLASAILVVEGLFSWYVLTSYLETLLKFSMLIGTLPSVLTEVAALNFGISITCSTLRCTLFSWSSYRPFFHQPPRSQRLMQMDPAKNKHSFRIWHCFSLRYISYPGAGVYSDNISALLMGLEYLINISYVDDTEVFKVCLDYWNSLVLELFELHNNLDNPAVTVNMMGLQMPLLHGMVDGLGPQISQRRQLYAAPMSKLRMLMICRMAKPEEVLIVEDENGNIVRETMKDNDVLVQYKIMRETLIYLSHLDHEDTRKQMLKKLSKQLSGEDWNWNNLNTLCWAIGSISGSMMEEQENRFLVMVIRDLLNLCEITKGKDNKAVIASNIMYVVGQYQDFSELTGSS
uniref:Exportin-1 C-terminal domain-containing protein n=1 Tax=Salix viminalis TaxID=40686 RepID=A0A6N2MYU8_SALVM